MGRHELFEAIHKGLGCKEGHQKPHLIFAFEITLIRGTGGVFEPIRECVNKFREIESAALSIAKQCTKPIDQLELQLFIPII